VTDTNYNWACAYANEFPFAVEDLGVDKLKNIAQEVLGLYGVTERWLEGFLGFEPRLATSKFKTGGKIQALRWSAPCLGRVRAVPRLCVLCDGNPLKTEGGKKHGENLSQGSWKVPVGHDSVYRHGHDRTASVRLLYTHSYPESNEDIPRTV